MLDEDDPAAPGQQGDPEVNKDAEVKDAGPPVIQETVVGLPEDPTARPQTGTSWRGSGERHLGLPGALRAGEGGGNPAGERMSG